MGSKSAFLSVHADLINKDDIIIHPNDGFDLGILALKKEVNYFIDGKSYNGVITLDNDCKHGIIIINKRNWNKLGQPAKLQLEINGDNCLFHFEK